MGSLPRKAQAPGPSGAPKVRTFSERIYIVLREKGSGKSCHRHFARPSPCAWQVVRMEADLKGEKLCPFVWLFYVRPYLQATAAGCWFVVLDPILFNNAKPILSFTAISADILGVCSKLRVVPQTCRRTTPRRCFRCLITRTNAAVSILFSLGCSMATTLQDRAET